MDTSPISINVIGKLDQLIAWRGQPKKIRVDNGPEFVAEALAHLASNRNIDIKFI